MKLKTISFGANFSIFVDGGMVSGTSLPQSKHAFYRFFLAADLDCAGSRSLQKRWGRYRTYFDAVELIDQRPACRRGRCDLWYSASAPYLIELDKCA